MMSAELIKGLQLPAFDVEMLSLGKLVVVPFKQHISDGETFWLYPSQQFPCNLTLEEYYKPEYLNAAKSSLEKYSATPFKLISWAVASYHWHIHPNNKYLLPKVAQSTVWNLSALEQIFEQFQVLKLLFLRVYYLPESCVINELAQPGAYFWARPEDEMVVGSENDVPIISETSFNQRKSLLTSGQPYPYIALESLQSAVAQIEDKQLEAKILNHDIRKFLGWASKSVTQKVLPAWINDIAARGNRSVQEDDGTSNYHAGTAFEIIVRQSLESLGFSVDYAHKGGAGGLDLFCSQPYSLVGECKSGKKIPNDTAVQLLNLGTIRLESKEEFNKSAKVIIGPGEPTEQLKKAAKVHGMAILNPATLQALVKLHHKHPVDLLKLKDYLVDGQADDEVAKFIDQSEEAIKLRSFVVRLVKNYLENANTEDATIYELHAVYVVSKPTQPLKREEMHEILIELSSPLTGYLGRRKGTDGTDRFYFLRDLKVE